MIVEFFEFLPFFPPSLFPFFFPSLHFSALSKRRQTAGHRLYACSGLQKFKI